MTHTYNIYAINQSFRHISCSQVLYTVQPDDVTLGERLLNFSEELDATNFVAVDSTFDMKAVCSP